MFRSIIVVAFVACIASGCAPTLRDRSSVSGSAKFRGESLGGFYLVLYSETTGGGGTEIKDDGTFAFAGAMQEGEYTVYVTIPLDVKGATREKLEAMNLPGKYRKAETSDYKVNIVPGKNVLDIDLKP